MIKFAHLADLHLGGWREKNLTNLNFKTFQESIKKILELEVDFVLFAGDIFNNAMPNIELVDKVIKEIIKLKKANIPLYVIGGSHDYSLTGKSFISLLESAGLLYDVSRYDIVLENEISLKYFIEPKTKTLISGILGKKNGLDSFIYSNIKSLPKSDFSIFMFHTTLNDFKPDFLKHVKTNITKSYLPKGFNYYAGGHVHTHMQGNYSNGFLSYPGPLFPNSFSELKREKPSFNFCEVNKNNHISIKRIFIDSYEIEYILFDINNLSSIDISNKIKNELEKKDLENKIVLLEVRGIVDGKIIDIGFSKIIDLIYEKGAFQVLKNTYKLSTMQTQIPKEELEFENSDFIEEKILKNYELENFTFQDIKSLLNINLEKLDGEKIYQYEQRVNEALEKNLNIY